MLMMNWIAQSNLDESDDDKGKRPKFEKFKK